MSFDATLVSLDLTATAALFHAGRSEALKSLAAEILPVFETRGLTTEAVVAYTLLQLQRAVAGRKFTVQLALGAGEESLGGGAGAVRECLLPEKLGNLGDPLRPSGF